jgi:hypothetical protein
MENSTLFFWVMHQSKLAHHTKNQKKEYLLNLGGTPSIKLLPYPSVHFLINKTNYY